MLTLLGCIAIVMVFWGIDYYRARHPKKTTQH